MEPVSFGPQSVAMLEGHVDARNALLSITLPMMQPRLFYPAMTNEGMPPLILTYNPLMKTASPVANMKDNDLHTLFVDELRDILWAEKALTKALPKMAKAAKSSELKDAFSSHLKETEGHVKRLEQVFESIGTAPRAKKCEAMAGLIKEGDELSEEFGETNAGDAALISAAQKVEHYEIASYGTLFNFAKLMGRDEAAELLQATLDEEGAADKKLTKIAKSSANPQANE
jgi:ferritin-like metal-binding protein YciE